MADRTIGIIGGGASGLMAAVSAARTGKVAPEHILILEKKDRIGKKLLVTGNGKCNLTNLDFSAEKPEEYYRGGDVRRLKRFFSRFSVAETMAYFRELGVLLTSRNGYIYPLSGQASTVLDAFRYETEKLGIQVRTEAAISEIRRLPAGGFEVALKTGDRLRPDRLILACGSPAGEKKGEGTEGYRYASAFGHHVYPPLPALVQLRCAGDYWKALAGVRCEAELTLIPEGCREQCRRERGELLLTDYGISGIPVFQLSRFATEALSRNQRVRIVIDFLPAFEEEGGDWKAFCAGRIRDFWGRRMEILFAGLANRKLLLVLMKRNGLKPQDILGKENRRAAAAALALLRSWEVTVTAANPFSQAQVCAGGVDLREVKDTLESRLVPGLYLCGELLDVDGRCGGYNLQWAWTSGRIAGTHAAEDE